MGRIFAMTAAMLMTTAFAVGQARAADVNVAVASNFAAPMKVIATEFERNTGHQVNLSFGSTGQFYAQIQHGAPFDLFLAANDQAPAKLAQEGKVVPGSRFTYAIGRLVLWSKDPGLIDGNADILKSDRFTKLAIANPQLAPYGAAALEVIERLGLSQALLPKLVQGKNIGQTFQFVSSGNAQLGFVASSQVIADGQIRGGSGWIVPDDYYLPIKQDAVFLTAGQHKAGARALFEYLKSDQARAIISSFGYRL
jgi:molybdate transport system substrate-binding protein